MFIEPLGKSGKYCFLSLKSSYSYWIQNYKSYSVVQLSWMKFCLKINNGNIASWISNKLKTMRSTNTFWYKQTIQYWVENMSVIKQIGKEEIKKYI